jgi:hypothetical protein
MKTKFGDYLNKIWLAALASMRQSDHDWIRKGTPQKLRRARAMGKGHGLARDVHPTPSTIASVKKRQHLYMHSHARRRLAAANGLVA